MNQNICFICVLWASSKCNKSLGTWEPKKFLSIEAAGLKSRVDPTLKIGGKVIKFHTLSIYSTTYVLRWSCAGECAWERSCNPHIWSQLCKRLPKLYLVKHHYNRTCQKNTFSVAVRVGIGDVTYQIILQSIFMTKKYELKNISTFVINI